MRHVPTAWNLLFNVAELKAGETVLIMGAGGNLGTHRIQIAKNVDRRESDRRAPAPTNACSSASISAPITASTTTATISTPR